MSLTDEESPIDFGDFGTEYKRTKTIRYNDEENQREVK